MAKGIRTIWIDSTTPEVIGVKVYRDDVEIADVGLGILKYDDPTPLPNVEYKYEVQAYTADAESENEVLGVNIAYYEIVEVEPLQIPTGIQLELIEVDTDISLYVSANGSGTEDGLTEANSMGYADARTAISTMNAGETMAFKRGEVYKHTTYLNINVSGGVGNPITFTAYGSGARPQIDSTDIYTGTWTNQGSNIWVSEPSAYNEQNPRLKINGNEVLGTKIQAELGTLIPDRVVFWNDDTTDTIHLYSTTDPSLDEVMYMRGSRAVYAYEQDNLVFDGIEFIGGYYGALMLAGTNNIEVKNCKMGDMCASGVNITDYGATTCSNITVHDNDMNSSFPFDYRGGTVDDSETTERGSSDGVKVGQCFGGSIYNNTFFDWGHTGVSLTAGSDGEVVNNFTVYNNTFSLSALRDYGGGFTIDRDSSGHEVYNNTMIGCKSCQVNGHGNHFHHNDVIDTKQTVLYTYAEGFGVDMATYAGDVYDNIIEFNNITNAESGAIRLRTSGTRNSGHRIRNNVTENCGSKNNNITVELNYGTTGIYDVNFDDNNFYNANFTDIYLDADTGDYEDIDFLNASTKYGINANNVNENPVGDATPIMTNFRVESATPNHIHFDTPLGPVTGLTIQGFIIEGHTISAIDTTLGYLTLSAPLTYWDNNTIRLEGGNGTVLDFDLQYIKNNIDEPIALINRYVNVSSMGSGDGTSEANAANTAYVNANAVAGQTWWFKAGDYGDVELEPDNDGTPTSPIKFIGYTNTIGDNPDINWSYPGNVDMQPSVMPLFTGTYRSSIRGLNPSSRSNLIIKNFQVTAYQNDVWMYGVTNLVVDNVIASYPENGEVCFASEGQPVVANNMRITNSVAYNGEVAGMRLYGHNTLVDNVQIVNDNTGMDYYLVANGNNSIFRNLYLERGEDAHVDSHTGHGMCLKAYGNTGTVPTERNLCENIDSVGIRMNVEARHAEVAYNVFRDVRCWSKGGWPKEDLGGIVISHGANYNIFDRITAIYGKQGIHYYGYGEDADAPTQANNNIIKNSIFADQEYAIRIDEDGDGFNRETRDEQYINCTFDNCDYMYLNASDDSHSNTIINSIITGINNRELTDQGGSSGFTYSYTDFFNNTNWSMPGGTGNLALDPDYTDAVSNDYTPQNDLLIDCIRQDGAEYDINDNERELTTTMGAIKDINE